MKNLSDVSSLRDSSASGGSHKKIAVDPDNPSKKLETVQEEMAASKVMGG
jgi:hypothetical protein